MRHNSTAIFVRCSGEEAERVRKAVNEGRRTLSGFILNAMFRIPVFQAEER